jgi:hypothetical protein
MKGVELMPSRDAFLMIPKSVLCTKRISARAKLVLAQLKDYRNRQTGQCNPRRAALAAALGTSEDSIKRALIELRRAGLVESKKGQRGNSYVILSTVSAGADPPATASASAKPPGRTVSAGATPPGTPVQMRPAEPAASLLTEPYLLNKKNTAAADKATGLLHGSGQPSAASAACSSAAQKNTNTNTCALARALVTELVAVHPQPGLPGKAFDEIHAVLTKAEDPEQTAARIRANHPPWVQYWSGLYADRFIPQLWRWIRDGEWQIPPVIRKPPKRQLYGQEAIVDVVERMRARYRAEASGT